MNLKFSSEAIFPRMVRAKKKISAFDGLEQESLEQTPALKRQRGVVDVVDDLMQSKGPGESMAATEGASCSPSPDPSFKGPTSVSSKPQEPFLVDSEDTEEKLPSLEAEFERMLEEEEANREAEGVAPVEPVGRTEDAEENEATSEKEPRAESSEYLTYAEEAPAAEKDMEVPKARPRWKTGSLDEEERNKKRITVLSSSSRRCSKTSSTPPKKASRRREEPEKPPEGREEEGGSEKQDKTEAVTLSDDDPLLPSASMARGAGRETSLWSKDDFAYLRRVIRRGQGRSIKTVEDARAFFAMELSNLPIEALKTPPFLISKQDIQSCSLHELGQLLQILYPMQTDESELEALCIRIKEEVNAKLLTAISSSLCSVGIKAGVHDLKEPYSEHLMALFRPISRFIKPSELEPTLVKIVVDFSDTLEDRMSAQTFLKLLTTIGATEKAFPSRQPLDIHVTKDIYPFWKTMMKTMIQEGRR